ncbi:recombination mediator RecR [Patescibacteria group bacterium]|nr:recombination mediator RecR [Patescibacteria group bacterium]MBU2263366.1 recombination mediator RecR [Patescibacteria group bacterium]
MFNRLIEIFLKFPGIGPRQAKRFAYFLAGQDAKFLKDFADNILEIKKDIKQCDSCFRFYAGPQCEICSNINRDKNLLMIVEKDVDLENIEKAGIYNGKYFVLGGTLSLTNSKNPPAGGLRFKELFNKVQKAKPLEIILATSATAEGENTSLYIEKILEPLRQSQGKHIKITRLGRGLSTGTELEYSDSQTISNALKNRK